MGTARGLFVVATAANLALLLTNASGATGVVLLALAAGCGIALLRARGTLAVVDLAVAGGVLVVVALARAPLGSHDLYSYAFYGRILEHYRANPYRAVPANFLTDPLIAPVHWRHAPSAYGPAFVGLAALLAVVIGHSVLLARLSYQMVAALALSGTGALVVRYAPDGTRRAAMLAANPLVWLVVVNGGHNDVLVGLGVVGAFLLAERRRPGAAGVAAAAAVGVKLSAVIAVAGIAFVLLARRESRNALRFGATTAGVLAAVTVAWPQWATAALHDTRGRTSRASAWAYARRALDLSGSRTTLLGLALTAVLAVFVVVAAARAPWRHFAMSDPAFVVAALAATYTVAAAYVLPWYTMWALPIAAFARDRRLYVWALAQGAWLTAIYQVGAGGAGDTAFAHLLNAVGPPVLLVLFVAIVVTGERPRFGAAARGVTRGVAPTAAR